MGIDNKVKFWFCVGLFFMFVGLCSYTFAFIGLVLKMVAG